MLPRAGAAAIAVVAALGVLRLWAPLDGDQALFLLGARALDHGGVLYVDVWDVKQPGIFWFYLAAGRLFGFTFEGVRLLELAWNLVFAVVLATAVRPLLRRCWLAALAPLALFVPYYAQVHPLESVQVESLAGLPLFLTAALLSGGRGERDLPGRGACAVAGVAAAVAAVFKLMLAPIAAVFLLVAATAGAPRPTAAEVGRRLVVIVPPFAGGVAVVLLTVVAVFVGDGALPELLWTSFVYPLQALDDAGKAPVHRLADASGWLLTRTLPWWPLAVVGVVGVVRGGAPPLARQMVAWLAAGATVVLAQRMSWWTYHLLLLFPPIAVLAVVGVDEVLARWRTGEQRRRRTVASAVAVVVAASLFLAPQPIAPDAVRLAAVLAAGGDREAYRRRTSAYWAMIGDSTALLRAEGRDDPIFVIGDPVYYLLAGRRPALAMHAWSPPALVPSQWARLDADLEATLPAWVFADHGYLELQPQQFRPVRALLARAYRAEAEDPRGTWYRRRCSEADGEASARP